MAERSAQRTARRSATAAAMFALVALTTLAWAAPPDTRPPLQHFRPDLHDQTALRDGAVQFMHQCGGCHSLKGTRYSALAKPLGLSRAQIDKHIDIADQPVDRIIRALVPASVGKAFLGTAPPDLTVIAKRHGADWLYTYLKSFYLDPSRPTGVNNVVFPNVAMPDVFANLQGLQVPVMAPGWHSGRQQPVVVGVREVSNGALTSAQFDTMARNIVTFLDYVSHPHQFQRHQLGPWILALFVLLTLLSYALYRSYWHQVVGTRERWWTLWKRK